ncbi:MAG TPA: TonB-dependent receptor [Bryobacteraceae bacterium]|nr:TonB-dependent receptor [Bryobacteraceae bacterium]
MISSRMPVSNPGLSVAARAVTLFLLLSGTWLVYSQGFGTLRGTVKDQSGSVIRGATVTLKSAASSWSQTSQTSDEGAFTISAVPFGQYTLEAGHEGFATVRQSIQIISGSAPNVQLTLPINATTSVVEVNAAATPLEAAAPEASSAPVMVSRQEIMEGLPGADRMSSLQFITETTPGAFVLHDHLHVRGGHQIDYLIDGVPIPNTNMSSNVGRAMDPKDIDEVEISRGGYGAGRGDRTFAQVNILTRSGFDFNNDADLTLTFGSFHQTNDQLGFGGHGAKFAYYGSASGNRTDLGLEPPSEQVIHNEGSGLGFFTNMSYNVGSSDNLRWTASLRYDHFQVPNFPDQQDAGFRDIDQERDSFVTFNWVHTFSPQTLLTVSPFYHYNNSQYISGAGDPLKSTSRSNSNYAGSQVELTSLQGPHNLQAGVYGFYQRNSQVFGLADAAASQTVSAVPTGGVGAAYVNDQYKPWHWLTLNAGLRLTHFSGVANENAANPRVGGTVQIPKLRWVVRAFYGTYYQAPPLYTVGGGWFGFELLQQRGAGFGFAPLRGERDIQREFGLTIPFKAWVLDVDHFATSSRDFLDHDVLGNSNILLPLTTPNARIRGTEATVRSPLVIHHIRFHAAFANMTAQFLGAPIGGLIKPVPAVCLVTYCFLDHDQRNTLTTGAQVQLPWNAWFSANVVHGSGVLAGDGPAHLPPTTTADVMLGKNVSERWSLGLTVLNISNSRFPFDINSSFAGTHFNNPREFIGSVRYRFHF